MKHRLALILPAYLCMYLVCYQISFLLRFDFKLSLDMQQVFWITLPYVLIFKGCICWSLGEWRRTFRYATLIDAIFVSSGAILAAGCLYLANSINLIGVTIPRSIIAIDCLLSILAGGLLRSLVRFYTEMFKSQHRKQNKERALIYRTDQTGISILRAMQSSDSKYRVVGFVDDSARDRESLLVGLPVFSTRVSWKKIARKLKAGHVLIPSTVAGKHVRLILDACQEAGLQTHVIPAVSEIVEGRYNLSFREVTIADLLRRKPAELDMHSIEQYVTGRCVLVTGGAGSIGSEVCRQILKLKPRKLIILDQSELGVFNMTQELKNLLNGEIEIQFVVADVVEQETMRQVMQEQQPELVFHAAAYKHVPLMQENPREAIRNNVLGTKTVADLADEFGIERFVLISTDKAVWPSSVMGATKFLAEKYIQSKAAASNTRYITVRFGNVLNSAGSVVPTFRKQIEAGGPVTVTHPEMERFFMTIPEAVQLVLQAGAIGGTGDVLILEMGQPVKIVDLAKDMIYLSGLKYPDDIDIVFTGMRPGEKLTEELFYENEDNALKVHDKIYCAQRDEPNVFEIQKDVSALAYVVTQPHAEAMTVLKEVVSHYTSADQLPVPQPTSTQLRAAA